MTFLDRMNDVLGAINGVIWADWVLYVVLGVGVLFTLWSGFCQYRALAHGTAVTAGKYDDKNDPGAINHFQALSAALSATVGNVVSVDVQSHADTGRSKGWALVTYSTAEEAAYATAQVSAPTDLAVSP